MTEQQEDYITETKEALEMLGKGYDHPTVVVEAPRKVTVRHEGKMVEQEEPAWVKFSTDFKTELADLSEYSLKVFIYIGLSVNFETGTAYPGVRKIAKDTKMDKDTVTKAVADLEERGFLTIQKREGNSNIYKPIRYISIGKGVPPEGTPEDGVSPEDAEVSPENAEVSLDSRVKATQPDKQESTRQGFSLEWMFAHGEEVTEQDMEAAILTSNALNNFEHAFGFGSLPWGSNTLWTKFQKFIVKLYSNNPTLFADYVAWRQDGGKYKAFSNRKIRENPQAFMDTGYPEYEASKMYRKTDETPGVYAPRSHKL